MGAPRLVHDEGAAPAVADVGDGVELGAGAVGGRAGHEGPAGIRMLFECLLECGCRRCVRQQPLLVPDGLHPHRADPREDQTRDHRLVGVPAHQQLLVRAGHRQHRGLHRQGAAAGGEEGVLGVDGVRHQLFGLHQDGTAGPAVVEPAGGQHVAVEDGVAQHLAHPGVGAPRLLVSGRGEPQLPRLVVTGQCFQYGCGVVVHASRSAPRTPETTSRPAGPHSPGRPWQPDPARLTTAPGRSGPRAGRGFGTRPDAAASAPART